MDAARSLRSAERFLLAPPLPAKFGSVQVAICDISAQGARFRHDKPIETGRKAVLKITMEGRRAPLTIEATVVWSHPEGGGTGRFVSGARTYGTPEMVNTLIAQLSTSKRSNRIEELRSGDRFTIGPPLDAKLGDRAITIENLSARGARIETSVQPLLGDSATLSFHVPGSDLHVEVETSVVWRALKAIDGNAKSYRVGLRIAEHPELIRLAIALLSDAGRATLDTQSLALKLKIIRARARQLAASKRAIEASGIPAEQYLLIQGVAEELRQNPEEAMHWYRRARLAISDRKTRDDAPLIADHPDAVAVWEYLDRTIDPSIIARALNLVR